MFFIFRNFYFFATFIFYSYSNYYCKLEFKHTLKRGCLKNIKKPLTAF